MDIASVFLSSTLLAGCATAVAYQPPPSSPRTVTATISVNTVSGVPVANVPLRRFEPLVTTAGGQSAMVILSEAGTGTASVQCQPSEETFGFALSGWINPAHPRASSFPDAKAHYQSMVDRYAFLPFYSVAMSSSTTAVSLPIVVRPSTSVDLTIQKDGVLRSGPAPVIEAVGYDCLSAVTGAGKYRVSGVPQGVAYELSVLDGTRLDFIAISSHTQPLALPEINQNASADTVSLDIKLSRAAGTTNAQGKTASLKTITLLRTDGSGGYQFHRGDQVGMPGPDRLKQFAGGGPETDWKPKIKPGEYWVLPRPWVNLPKEIAFRQLVVAGRDVTGAGLPKITAVAGQPLTVTIDGDQIQQSFEAFTKPLVQAKLPILGPDAPSYVPTNP